MNARSPFHATTFDVDRVLSQVDGDVELLGELRQLFMEDSAASLAEAEGAIERRDGAALWRCAHGLKGAVGNFAAVEAVGLAVRLEHESKTGEFETAGATLAEIGRTVDLLMTELGAFLEELGARR